MESSKAVRLAASFLLSLLLICVFACSDETSTPDAGGTDQGTEDVAADTTIDSADVGDDEGAEETGLPDAVDEEVPVDPCEGSISCMDPDLDRPRTSICFDNDFPPGSSCQLVPGGGEACCIPPFACETDEDCEAERVDADFCPDEAYGCACNTADGTCFTFVCFTDAECDGDQVCRDGNCTDEGSTAGLVARLVTPSGPITEGETQQLIAVAVDPDDDSRVFSDIAISWTSDVTDRVAVDSSGAATGGSTAGSATITARVTDNGDDTGDTIELFNYTDHDQTLRVIVFDETSRTPVDDAPVIIELSDSNIELATSATGEAFLSETVTFPVGVHVLAPDYEYVSVIGVDTDDLLISVRPTTYAEIRDAGDEHVSDEAICETIEGENLCYELEGVSAVVGVPDYSSITKSGEIDVALTGFEMANGLLDLNFEIIVGANVSRDLSNGPVPIDGLSDMPGGVTLALIGDAMIPTYVLTSAPAERVIWTLGGRVSLSENPNLLPELIEQFNGDADIGRIVALILPVFRDFYVGVTSDYAIDLADEGLSLSRHDNEFFVPMRRPITMLAPTVPLSETRPLETGLFIAGAVVPGRGFVPLGVTAAVDDANGTPFDGVLDGDTDTDEIEPISMNVGPIHGGLAAPGTYYAIVGVALGLGNVPSGQPDRENGVGFIHRLAPGELPPATIDLAYTAFYELPEGSSWNSDTRLVTIVSVDDQDVDFYRVNFRADRDRKWSIFVPPSITEYTVPDLTGIVDDFEDRTNAKQVTVLTVDLLGDGDDAVTFADVLPPVWPTAIDLAEVVEQFSRLELKD